MYEKIIENYIDVFVDSLKKIDIGEINKAINTLIYSYENNKQVFILGNGGSAATASHMVCDLAKGAITSSNYIKKFSVYSLCDNIPIITAWSNDESYEYIFERQLRNVLCDNDLVIAISASGNSPNIIKAVEFAKDHNSKVIGMTGFSGGKLNQLSDVKLHIPLDDYGQVEDFHLICNHIITKSLKHYIENR